VARDWQLGANLVALLDSLGANSGPCLAAVSGAGNHRLARTLTSSGGRRSPRAWRALKGLTSRRVIQLWSQLEATLRAWVFARWSRPSWGLLGKLPRCRRQEETPRYLETESGVKVGRSGP
jgi:hypothetical protein